MRGSINRGYGKPQQAELFFERSREESRDESLEVRLKRLERVGHSHGLLAQLHTLVAHVDFDTGTKDTTVQIAGRLTEDARASHAGAAGFVQTPHGLCVT